MDTTVVESNIHYPTDSSLLGDGTRVLTRTMKKIENKAGGLKGKVRDRMRSIRKRVLAIALSTRLLGPSGEERRKRQYRELLRLTRKVILKIDLSAAKGSISSTAGWRWSFDWGVENRHLMTKRAYAALLLVFVSSVAASQKE